MLHKSSITLIFPLLAAIGGGLALLPDQPAAPPGPGGVIETVKDFLIAMDGADLKTLVAVLDVQARGRDGYVVVPDEAKPWGFRQSKDYRAPRFVDLTWDGHTITESDRKQFVHRVRRDLGGKGKGRSMVTKIISIRADCPSANASYAIVEFERSYTQAGKAQGTHRFIATALMRHVSKKRAVGDPDFRIFHWHATRVTPPPAMKKGG